MRRACDVARADQGQVQGEAMAGVAQQRQGLALGLATRQLIPAHIAWGEGQRDAQRPLPRLGSRQLDIAGFDHNRLIRLQPGDLQGKDIGAFAGGEGGLATFGFGLGIVGFRLLAFLEFGHDLDLAKAHRDPHHRGIAGERKAVARFERAVTDRACIGKGVGHPQIRQWAEDAASDGCALKRNKLRGSRFCLHHLKDGDRTGLGVFIVTGVEHG
jgi:hypothetical protein